ncbi:Cytochrome bo(3) ubiquinol oxidase subunit 3 [Pseudovibrio axinellae]|uniref:Cytochrome bo(3) ubiquinol oxidase subunit 3 n=1 Tax=Pseudovibrio axinellae TaxID=989403 RepID=A0A165VSN3_9HYPH|nr:cytochrome (ubi)quinol oxidase subunit III [Pseudovibrio axinellae]KZL15384.1 Cytochrome bo(3) ubiquinol oxidase subunit 3 [Pseudovibrio axinellae]SER54165.1 cytochrome bo3 quinol oxidase subunit 3 [Pseudovibrio axinellae]
MNSYRPTTSRSPGPTEETLDVRDFGFWLYLMTDAVIFSLLFATYVVMFQNTATGPLPVEVFDIKHVFAETMFLLVSSVTFGFASLACVREHKGQAIIWLIVTIIFGLGFISLEVAEFVGMINSGAAPQTSGFLTAFFSLVGTHGAHVSLGMIGITVMIFQILIKGLTSPVKSRLHRLGMFWHFLDIVWIGIFSIVYMPAWLI